MLDTPLKIDFDEFDGKSIWKISDLKLAILQAVYGWSKGGDHGIGLSGFAHNYASLPNGVSLEYESVSMWSNSNFPDFAYKIASAIEDEVQTVLGATNKLRNLLETNSIVLEVVYLKKDRIVSIDYAHGDVEQLSKRFVKAVFDIISEMVTDESLEETIDVKVTIPVKM